MQTTCRSTPSPCSVIHSIGGIKAGYEGADFSSDSTAHPPSPSPQKSGERGSIMPSVLKRFPKSSKHSRRSLHRSPYIRWGLMIAWGVATFDSNLLAQGLSLATPESCQMDASQLGKIDALVTHAIVDQKMPGCVVCIGRHGKIVWLKAFGNKRLEPTVEPMTTDTVFDMASITKPVATATCIMRLVEDGKISLSDKVAAYFPLFSTHGKDSITIQNLLLHQSGLIPDNALSDYDHGPEEAWKRICDLKLAGPVGSSFKYSDVNFIVLGKIVEHVSGKSLEDRKSVE